MCKTVSLIFLTVLFSLNAFGQQYKAAPLQVKRSTLIEDIKQLKAANPKITTDELVAAANALLDKEGVNASISFDAATCENIKKVRAGRKDPNAPIRLSATLKSVDEPAPLALPEPQFVSDDCGGCFIDIPVVQLTANDFVTVISGRNIKFALPANFKTNTVELLDTKTPTTIKRKWPLPFRSTPMGIMFDENVIFLGFNDPDLADLTLLVFGEGTFQIGTRKDAEDGGPGTIVETPAEASNGKRIKFDRWKNTYLIDFRPPCGN